MEHAVYLCAWQRSSSGFALWVKSRPTVRGEGPSYEEAEERLIDAIQAAGGAMHVVLEFDPPLPRSERESKYSQPELYVIDGDDRSETEDIIKPVSFETAKEREERFQERDSFFQAPSCRQCAFASSPRSEKPLPLRYAPPRYDGAFGSIGAEGTTTLHLVSAEFLELLTQEERNRLTLRLTLRKGRARKFYELLGPPGPPFVAVAGLPISGWRCEACGHRTWGYWVEALKLCEFVARDDLPCPLPSLFTIGTPPGVNLCVTGERWRARVGHKGTRGFVSQPLGVVPSREVVRNPELPTFQEQLAEQPWGRRARLP
jgi:hypothetical protein